jgi:2-polyprenyl-3-methyl-5-hydroxy-6-metoxy-1,4-benzoquinol methylase
MSKFSWGTKIININEKSLPSFKMRFVLENIPKKGRIVDIGSGGGKVLKTISNINHNYDLHGCDIRTINPTQEYTFSIINKNSKKLPYPSGFADCVLIIDVLEHVKSPVDLLKEALRILKKNGTFITFTPTEGQAFSAYSIYKFFMGKNIYVDTKDHINSFSRDELINLIEKDFYITKTIYSYHFFGQFFDATFFALTKLKFISNFFWKNNTYYKSSSQTSRSNKKSTSNFIFNWILKFFNCIAYFESSFLSKCRFGSAGILIKAKIKK